ncbi:uncharacterized protein I206_103939 [Kwoniella pini CBS 10737]|uniref:Uncharacterized protein n=1 Tax=Kwoniella pini CBS 10737 TaxID=1296096 RepID=A0A1B9I345_9TREE|nr:uncharacterized protein I206_04488 [Kwoniella pini CBS 10737]OCF49957.1 hypothetical protein I206_04488 [Kwoniella pini CBS 10737]
MEPSSPTPYRDSTSLIPSSPLQPGQFRKGHLRSSSRETILKGLSNWRRQAKSTSTSNTGLSIHSDINYNESRQIFKVEKSKSTQGSSSKRLGLGMGMRGTPAKKIKRSSKASIGTMSTPRMRKHSQPDGQSSEQSERSTTASSDALESGEEITSPSISDPETSRIVPRSYRSDNPTLSSHNATYDMLSSSSTRTARNDYIFTGKDFIIPLNDASSTRHDTSVQSTPHPSEDPAIISEPDSTPRSRFIVMQNQGQVPNNHDLEFSIPLNDITQPSVSRRQQHMGRSSSGSSKIKQRVSTPRKIPGMQSTPSVSASSVDDTDRVGPDADFFINPSPRNDQDIEDDSSIETIRGNKAAVLSPSEMQEDMTFVATRRGQELGQITETGVRETISYNSNRNTDIALGDHNVVNSESHNEVCFEVPHTPPANLSVITPSKEPISSSEAPLTPTDVDDTSYGFGWLQVFVQDKIPRPFRLSSEPDSSLAPTTPSSLTFSSRSEPDVHESGRSDISSPPSTVSIEMSKGKWRGAEALKRMEGGLYPQPDLEELDPIHNHTSEKEKRRRTGLNKQGTEMATREKRIPPEQVPKLTPDVMDARQDRIAHYIDLAENYKLNIEYVLW